MKEERVIKADEIVSKHDMADVSLGRVVMALGIGAICSEKLRKIAKYLLIGGALIQVPAILRVTKKAVKFAKQVKKQKSAEAEQEKPVEDLPAESEPDTVVETTETAAETAAEPTVDPASELTTPNLDHLNHPCEPSSHPHEDPNF